MTADHALQEKWLGDGVDMEVSWGKMTHRRKQTPVMGDLQADPSCYSLDAWVMKRTNSLGE